MDVNILYQLKTPAALSFYMLHQYNVSFVLSNTVAEKINKTIVRGKC